MEVPGKDNAGRLGLPSGDAQQWEPKEYFSPYYGPISEVPGLSADHADRMTDAGLTGWMHAPLSVSGQLLGYLAVQGRPRNGYAARHFVRLERIASLLAPIVRTLLPLFSLPVPEGSIEPGRDRAAPSSTNSMGGSSGTGLSRPVKVLVVDDYPVCLTGLSTILSGSDLELVGATNWAGALAEMAIAAPDVVLADAHSDDSTLLFLQREADNEFLPPLLVILEHPEREEALRYLAAGASGIIARETPARQMVGAIEQIAGGRSVVEPPLVDVMLSGSIRIEGPADSFQREALRQVTARDRAILKSVASGHTNAEIAAEVHLAAGTVRNRLAELYRILGVRDRGAAVYTSMRLGLID